MDKIDRMIIIELMKNARMPFLRIAKKIDVSSETVRQRYSKMRKEGTIMHSSISIDLSKIGYNGKVFLMITNAPNHDKSVTFDALKKIQDIFIISEMIGDCEILGIAAVKNLNGLKKLMNEIKELPSVSRVEFAIINDTAFPVNSRFAELFI